MRELERIAPMVVCPMCDEVRCVGRDVCKEIKLLIEKQESEQEDA